MGLKQDIVVVSRFSYKKDGKGTRGNTPGDYIKRYMARDLAVENIAPTRASDTQGALSRFQERELSVFEEEDIPSMKRRMKKAQKRGGVAFGNGDEALSDEKLKAISKDFQAQFDTGKTAIETILSFTEQYLRDHNCLDPDFVHTTRGDFANHVDQLKLRMAIMHGIERMSAKTYDDLHYVGVIQVDTDHVHCHLCMVDYGEGRKANDGSQRGKLTARDMQLLRRSMDNYLDEKKVIQMMSSSVMHDKRNAVCYIKQFTHRTLNEQGLPQFLISCLPDNRNWWSANSNRKEMRKANAIVRDYVINILQPEAQAPTQFYRDAHDDIVKYADERQRREGLSNSERMKLIRNGEEKLFRSCMNGVYQVLKEIPKKEMEQVRTPMLDAMSMDYEEMAAQAVDDPMMEFGFRLRSYSNRLSYHRKLYHKFRREAKAYDEAENKSEDSKALGDYLAFERDYQRMLMVKYLHFLSFVPLDENIQLEFEEIMNQADRLERMSQMENDPELLKLDEEEMDRYGWETYGIGRASFIKKFPAAWEVRMNNSKARFDKSVTEFREKLQDYGMDFDGKGVTRQKPYTFDEVKALDLHHLTYDFPYDVKMSKKNTDTFIKYARERAAKYKSAVDYLERTDQADKISELPSTDVRVMEAFATAIDDVNPELKSARASSSSQHNGATVRLGRDYGTSMREAVRAAVEAVKDMNYEQ